jgi:hypothetical protein
MRVLTSGQAIPPSAQRPLKLPVSAATGNRQFRQNAVTDLPRCVRFENGHAARSTADLADSTEDIGDVGTVNLCSGGVFGHFQRVLQLVGDGADFTVRMLEAPIVDDD